MKIYTYLKLQESLENFQEALSIITGEKDELFVTSESRRCFRELERIKEMNQDDIYLISSLKSLGMNDGEIAAQLSWFIDHGVKLVICEIPATYEFGVTQPMNQAVLSTLLHGILQTNPQTISASFQKKKHSGRHKMPFPDQWDELYEKWENGEITSKDFMISTGLKKATFYNLLTEYKEIQKNNQQYLQKYRVI